MANYKKRVVLFKSGGNIIWICFMVWIHQHSTLQKDSNVWHIISNTIYKANFKIVFLKQARIRTILKLESMHFRKWSYNVPNINNPSKKLVNNRKFAPDFSNIGFPQHEGRLKVELLHHLKKFRWFFWRYLKHNFSVFYVFISGHKFKLDWYISKC